MGINFLSNYEERIKKHYLVSSFSCDCEWWSNIWYGTGLQSIKKWSYELMLKIMGKWEKSHYEQDSILMIMTTCFTT